MACTASGDLPGVIRIGLALRAKKLRRYATPSIVAQAASKGIELVPIGISGGDRPLRDQGPFHAILHKLLPDDPFYAKLESYCNANPHVRVLDELKHVNSIRNREGMLHALKGGIITANPYGSKESCTQNGLAADSCTATSPAVKARQVPLSCTYSAPKQVTVPRDSSLHSIKEKLTTAGIFFPIMSKPLQADGSDGSHCISMFLSENALEALINLDSGRTSEAFILQQFQEHNGVLYKCYVLGDLTEICLRPSLHLSPDLKAATASSSGVLILPRFSTTPLPASGGLALDVPASVVSHLSRDSSQSAPCLPPCLLCNPGTACSCFICQRLGISKRRKLSVIPINHVMGDITIRRLIYDPIDQASVPIPAMSAGQQHLPCARARVNSFTRSAGGGSSELGSSDSNSQPPTSSRTPSLGALHVAPSEPHPPVLMTETSTESADPLEVEDLEDTGSRSMRASWPQLQEIGRLVEQLRPRKVRSRSGHAMVSWQARTGEGKEVQVEIQDPGELHEAFQRDRDRDGGTAGAVPDDPGAPWAAMPPDWSIRQLARQLQAKSGLRLFNLDVICPVGQAGRQDVEYRVVDINYFPGFDKLPQFETKFVDFLVGCGREAVSASPGGR